MHSRARSVAILLAINLPMLVLVVAVVELAFGNWFRPFVPPVAVVVDRSYTYQQNLYDPPGPVHYFRDQYGLRGVREPLAQIDLVTVGGSTTDQRYISEGQTWQDVMRQACNVRVANAGVDGMSSVGPNVAVSEWLHRIPDLKPKLYLHYLGVNDASLGAEPRRSDLTSSSMPLWQDIRRKSAIAIALEAIWRRANPVREVGHGQAVVPAGAAPSMKEVSPPNDRIEKFV